MIVSSVPSSIDFRRSESCQTRPVVDVESRDLHGEEQDPGQGVHPPDQLFLIFTGNHLEENRTSPTTTSRL
jgi:hypothetical protein